MDTGQQPSSSAKGYLRFAVLTFMILLAAFGRVIPHMPNFSPLGAIGLFGAAYYTKTWQALVVPITATWLSDLFITNVIYGQYYPEFTWFYEGFYWQYGSYLFITLAGLLALKRVTLTRVLLAAVLSSTIFFLVSNYQCRSDYPAGTDGLIACYVGGISYLKGTVLGDLFFTAVLFGVFELAQRQFPVLRAEPKQN